MGKDINDMFWKFFLNNVAVRRIASVFGCSESMTAVVLVCVSMSAVLLLFRAVLRRKGVPVLEYFGVPEVLMAFSVREMAVRLPILHVRLNRALDGYAEVICNYPEYTERYVRMTGDTELHLGSVVRYAYHMKDTSDDFLYMRICRTVKSIRGCVDSTGILAVWILAAVLLIAALAVALRDGCAGVAVWLLRSVALLYCAWTGAGMFAACFIAWWLGISLSLLKHFFILGNEIEPSFKSEENFP